MFGIIWCRSLIDFRSSFQSSMCKCPIMFLPGQFSWTLSWPHDQKNLPGTASEMTCCLMLIITFDTQRLDRLLLLWSTTSRSVFCHFPTDIRNNSCLARVWIVWYGQLWHDTFNSSCLYYLKPHWWILKAIQKVQLQSSLFNHFNCKIH